MKRILLAIAVFLLASCAGNDYDVRVITDFYKAVLGFYKFGGDTIPAGKAYYLKSE